MENQRKYNIMWFCFVDKLISMLATQKCFITKKIYIYIEWNRIVRWKHHLVFILMYFHLYIMIINVWLCNCVYNWWIMKERRKNMRKVLCYLPFFYVLWFIYVNQNKPRQLINFSRTSISSVFFQNNNE